MHFKILMVFVLFDFCYCVKLFEFGKYPGNHLPTGTTHYEHIFQADFALNNSMINFF